MNTDLREETSGAVVPDPERLQVLEVVTLQPRPDVHAGVNTNSPSFITPMSLLAAVLISVHLIGRDLYLLVWCGHAAAGGPRLCSRRDV